MFDLDRSITFIISMASKKLSEILNNELIKYGVTKSQWVVMYYINRESNISQKRLSTLMNAKEPTTTGIIDRVETEGLVERIADETDRRKKVLMLTGKGKLLNDKILVIVEDFKNRCLENVSIDEQETFLKVLDHLVVGARNWELQIEGRMMEKDS